MNPIAMPRYRATNSFSGPVAHASKGSEIDLTEEQAAQLGGLIEEVGPTAAEQAAAEQAAKSSSKKKGN